MADLRVHHTPDVEPDITLDTILDLDGGHRG